MFLKDFTTKLNRKTRHSIERRAFLYGADTVSMCLGLIHKIRVPDSNVINDLENLLVDVITEFAQRCNASGVMTGNRHRVSYAKQIIKKRILPVVDEVLTHYMARLKKLDTINILGNYSGAPRFHYVALIERTTIVRSKVKKQMLDLHETMVPR